MSRTIRYLPEGFPTETGLDTALSRAMLVRASQGLLEESFRLHVPGRIVAFGKRDTLEPGFPVAAAAARRHGYLPIERLAGGRAAVFHEGTLAFTWTVPVDDPRSGIRERFSQLSGLMVAAFRRLGVDAAVGEVPGEYCPGDWSVNAGGRIKLMGVGQRLARHAVHVGGVVVVTGANAINEVLLPVYGALGIEWRPDATGALADVVPGIGTGDAIAAIGAELRSGARILDGRIDRATLELARSFIDEHLTATPAASTHGRLERGPGGA